MNCRLSQFKIQMLHVTKPKIALLVKYIRTKLALLGFLLILLKIPKVATVAKINLHIVLRKEVVVA